MANASRTLCIGTRKGLFAATRNGAGWSIGAPHFPGDPVTQFAAEPDGGAWYAALRMGHFGIKVRKSTDGGASWSEMAAPAFPPKPTEGPLKDDPTPWTVDLLWGLEATKQRLWAGCLPAGLFTSTDGAASWQLVESLWERPDRMEWFGGGYDHAGIHSVLVDPRDSRHLTIAVSCGGVWQSGDAGAQWELSAAGMKADFVPPERTDDQNIQDPHRMVQCAADPDVLWVQHHCGLYRSTDGARGWHALAAPKPTGFGFAVACDPNDPRRAWFVPAESDARRIPLGGRVVVSRTDDGGKTFAVFGEGLPQTDAYHLAYRHALDVGADGATLALASTTGGLWTSADAGESWHCVSRDLPPVAVVHFAAPTP